MDKEKDEENKQMINKKEKEEVSLPYFVIKCLVKIILFMGVGWLTSIIVIVSGFLWYLGQYDYVSDNTTTTIDGGETGDANYINSGGDVSNIINGKGDLNNYGKDNNTNNEETTN